MASRRASAREKLPKPQNRSNTCSPDCGSSAATAFTNQHRVYRRVDLHKIQGREKQLPGRTHRGDNSTAATSAGYKPVTVSGPARLQGNHQLVVHERNHTIFPGRAPIAAQGGAEPATPPLRWKPPRSAQCPRVRPSVASNSRSAVIRIPTCGISTWHSSICAIRCARRSRKPTSTPPLAGTCLAPSRAFRRYPQRGPRMASPICCGWTCPNARQFLQQVVLLVAQLGIAIEVLQLRSHRTGRSAGIAAPPALRSHATLRL